MGWVMRFRLFLYSESFATRFSSGKVKMRLTSGQRIVGNDRAEVAAVLPRALQILTWELERLRAQQVEFGQAALWH
jgi:hypothetical protein